MHLYMPSFFHVGKIVPLNVPYWRVSTGVCSVRDVSVWLKTSLSHVADGVLVLWLGVGPKTQK